MDGRAGDFLITLTLDYRQDGEPKYLNFNKLCPLIGQMKSKEGILGLAPRLKY